MTRIGFVLLIKLFIFIKLKQGIITDTFFYALYINKLNSNGEANKIKTEISINY